MPRALVVGPSSMLGSRLSEHLRARGWQVIGAGRSAGCEIPLELGAEVLRTDFPQIEADVLFHCAAAFGDDSPEGAWLNDRVNVLGAHQILALARSAGCRQIVYAGSTSSARREGEVFASSYGASKARAEGVLAWGLALSGRAFVSLRFAQLYDERGDCIRHQRWFGRIISYARSGRVLRLPPGDAPRNFVHVRDAVAVMVAAAEAGVEGVVHVCHPLDESYAEIAHQACAVFGGGARVEIAQEKTPFWPAYFPPASPEVAALGVTFMSMAEGLRSIRDGGYAARFEVFDVA
ncbi:NAD-dependent epimerase/dehydratase family protein [Pseudomonas subflava]|uniref:NAD-dependent epimerase/dehydratase family protein n=1 Tax=Pseudomonas subflava TaxID=2952933 RepID=UPI00207A56FA|nr:NAD(P)-dependent oxidoreductase [Pseudomonas subflava]